MRKIFNNLKRYVDFRNKVVLDTNPNQENLEFLIGEKPKKIYFLYNCFRDLSSLKTCNVDLVPISSDGKDKITENTELVLTDCGWANPENFRSLKSLGTMFLNNKLKKISKLVLLGWKPDSNEIFELEQKAANQKLLDDYLEFLLKLNSFKAEANGTTSSMLSRESLDSYLDKSDLPENETRWLNKLKDKLNGIKLPIEFGYDYFQIFGRQMNLAN